MLKISRKLIFVAVVVGMVSFFAACEQPPPPPEPVSTPAYRGTIVAMGDSLTDGLGVDETMAYPARLERKLASVGHAFRVVNAGISGETSSGAFSRINWVLTLEPDIVVLETGANDGLRGLDPGLVEKNIHNIVRTLKSKGVVVVLAGMQMVENMGPEYTAAFARIYPAVAETEQVVLVPFFLQGVAGESQYNQYDGIHPTAEGYRIVTDTVYPYVLEAIGQLPSPHDSP